MVKTAPKKKHSIPSLELSPPSCTSNKLWHHHPLALTNQVLLSFTLCLKPFCWSQYDAVVSTLLYAFLQTMSALLPLARVVANM